MKAAVYRQYGPPDVLRIEDVAKPVPQDGELLVRIHAATVCSADWRLRKADPFLVRLMNGIRRPRKIHILGMEFAGRVESRGNTVSRGNALTRFAEGDEVFGLTGFKFGTRAEYVCVPQNGELKPANMTFEEAAAVSFGGVSALHFLRKAEVQPGQRVLIYGASGSVGTSAVQLAKHLGAHVTGVCGPAHLALVKSLGADEVIDYTTEDFSRASRAYDVILDTVGKSGFPRSMKALRRGGCYALVAGSGPSSWLGGLWASLTGAGRVIGGIVRGGPDVQAFLKELVEDGKLRSVIDRCYPLEQIADAHRYVEAGHKKGNVVIVFPESSL